MCLHSQYDENACSYIDSVCQIHMWHVVHLQMLDGNRTINMAIHNIIIMYITLHCMLLYALATMHPCIHNDA